MLQNKVRYLVLLVSMGLLAVYYNEYYVSMLFLTIIIMPFLLFGILCYYYGKIKVELSQAEFMANKDEKLPIVVKLNNPTLFPVSFVKINITYKNSYAGQTYKKTLSACLDYKTTTSVYINLTSRYSGNMEITLDAIRVYDYIKLFSLKKKINKKMKLAILPSFYELEELNIFHMNRQMIENDLYSPIKRGDDPLEVFEIREYREGDRLQKIHWKLSRKQNQLMIKEFSDPLESSALIFVDINLPVKGNILFFMDAILECALSLSYSLRLKGLIHYLAWYDNNSGVCQRVSIGREEDFYQAIDGLLQIHPDVNCDHSLIEYIAQYPHEQYSDLIFITGVINENLIDSMALVRSNTKQMLYMQSSDQSTDRTTISQDLMLRTDDAGIHIHQVELNNVRRDLLEII